MNSVVPVRRRRPFGVPLGVVGFGVVCLAKSRSMRKPFGRSEDKVLLPLGLYSIILFGEMSRWRIPADSRRD